MLSAQGWANFPANQARITIDINGAPHPALTLRGEEGISTGFEFVLSIIVDKNATLNSYIGATTHLQFHGQDGIARTVIGVVTKIHELGWFDETRLRVELTFESSLAKLKYQKDTRIILGHTVPDMIRATCERNGLIKDQLHFDLSRSYPIKPYTLQANESDWDFISRLAANSGIYFYSIVKDETDVIVFTDHNAHCPYIAREVLHFIEPSGANKEMAGNALVGIHQLAATARQVIPQARVHDFNEDTPSTQLLASTAIDPITQLKATPAPGETLFGLGTRTLDASDVQSKRIAEHAAVQAFDLTANGNVVDMAAGHICSVEATHFDAQYSGDYLITHVIHEASQFAGHNEGDEDIAYRAAATCIKRETPFRSATVNHPELPMTLTARIESDGPYARLDEQGKYQLRTLFDLSSTQHTQASIPMRRVSAYGGAPNESNVGLHTPLHDGDEVLISCLNGDPDRPMIVGTLPNPERLSPVTSKNPAQNRLRTLSDNELTFDDTKQQEAITLRTYSGYNILHLDAAAVGHKVRLASEHGAMVTFAKKTIHRQSDDTMTERVGNDRLVKVKNYHRTETQTKEIHHQANTDHKHTAYKNIQTESGKNTELQTGRHMILDVEDNAKITVKGPGGLFATIHNNDVFIQSANKIDIKGQGGGDITFEQSGGGFKVSKSGVVSFYGNKVFFGGSGGVQLNGKVNYSVPGPQPPGAVSTQ
ncbi:MAG: type VI secretion system Vgr family protein, partial [Thioalkalispiraceae bacterium]